MNNKLVKNISFQSFYQVLIVITPLITSPYLSRVLGPDKLGEYSYTYSIVNYFTIFAHLGTQTYGSKCISSCGEDRKKRSIVFSEILSMQLIVSFISLISYIVFLKLRYSSFPIISLLQTIFLFECISTLNWFFFGVEDFKRTVVRNTIVKILTISSIFLFVKNQSDLGIYIIIISGSEVIGQIIMIPSLRKYIDFVKPSLAGIKQHFKPNFILFLPAIAYTVNHVLDKTMIGVFSTYTQNGFYYNVEKVVNIPKGLITGIGVVMLPRISNNIAKGNSQQNNTYLTFFIYIVFMLSSAMAFGISAVSKEFVPVFFGDGYDECISLLSIMSFALIFMSLSDTFRMQFLIPNNQEKIYITAVAIGAVINFLMNISLIPRIGAKGAVYGTLVAEFIAMIIQMCGVRKYVDILNDMLKSFVFILDGLLMYFVVRLIAIIFLGCNNILSLIIEILVGGVFYLFICLVSIKFFVPELFNQFKSYLIKVKNNSNS